MFDFEKANLDDLIQTQRAYPDAYQTNLYLGLSLAGTRTRQLEAEPYLLTALSFGKVDDYTRLLLRRLSWIKTLKADYEGAAALLRMAGQMFPNDPNLKLELSETLMILGDMESASCIQGEVMSALRQSAQAFAQKENQPLTVLLEPSAVIGKFIGEMAAKLDLYVKARALGLVGNARAVLCLPENRTVNRDFADYWRSYVSLVTDLAEITATKERYKTSWIFTDHVTFPDGKTWPRDLAYRIIQNQWEKEGREPLLTLKDEHRERGQSFLRQQGMPEGGWFVALHVRSPGFFKEDSRSNANFRRNADIMTYLPAIGEITRRGGWVVRLGDSSTPRLPKMAQVIDYAHLDREKGWLDVFLVAASRFFLGTSSGPVSMAENFGTPIIGANWCGGGRWLACKGDLILPKLMRRTTDGRLLTMEEMVAPPYFMAFQSLLFDKHGLEMVDNTAEDIRDSVVEMLENLEGRGLYSLHDEAVQQVIKIKADPYGLGLNVRFARDFLRRRPELLG